VPVVIGVSSRAIRPDAIAFPARCCDVIANRSCASRDTLHCSATRSAVSPIASVPCSSCMRGFTNRQPSVLS
jgi:hypothetical protein